MNEININEIIKIEQMPKVFSQLENIGKIIKEKTKDLDKLKCTDENKQIVKNRRTEVNKTIELLENRRIQIKNKLLEPYKIFEEKYKEECLSKLQNTSNLLTDKINEIENDQKTKKEKEVREFANEHIISRHLESIIDANNIKLNVTLSISMKKLKDEVLEFIDRVDTDIKMIELEEFKDEILVEYKNNLNFAESKMTVVNRHKALEEMKMKEAIRVEAVEEDKQVVEMVVEELHAPVEIATQDEEPEEQLMVVAFQVTATVEQIKELKQWLKERNIQYA